MKNETRYDGRTILSWIRASFRARNNPHLVEKFLIRICYTSNKNCHGSVSGNSYAGYLRLSLPRDPATLRAADLAFTIDYLTLLFFGVKRRDMSEAQKVEGYRKWAVGLPMPAFRAEKRPVPTDKRTAAERRAKRAKNMYAKYDLLEAACAAELIRLGKLKKQWKIKVDYYAKKGL